MMKPVNAVIGAVGVALLTIGVAAQTGSIHLPSLGGTGTLAHRPSNAPPIAQPTQDPSPSPTPAVLAAQPSGDGNGKGHGNGNGNGDGD